MRLVSLNIDNFRVIRSARLEFPDRVIGIIGPNGAGKSSIIEAIAWALYSNQAARSGKDEIKAAFARPDEDCRVELIFYINEEKYRVVRKLTGRNEKQEVELYRGEKSESVGVNETKAYVGQLLGLDWRGFLSSFLARQAELNALSDLTPAKRQDHIAGMLGIEKLDKAITRVKEAVKSAKERAAFLERQISHKGEVEKRLTELREGLLGLADPIAQAQKSHQEALVRQKEAAAAVGDSQKEQGVYSRLQAELESHVKSQEEINRRLKRLNEEESELKKAQAELNELEKQLSVLSDLKIKLDELTRRRDTEQVRTSLAKQQAEALKETESLKVQKLGLAQTLEKLRGELSAFPIELGQLLDEVQRLLDQKRDEFRGLLADEKKLQEEVNKAQRQLTSIADLGPDSICDRCLRPLGQDYKSIRGHFESELEALKRQQVDTTEKLRVVKQEGENLNEQCEKLKKQKEAAYKNKVDYEAAANRVQLIEKQIKDSSKRGDELSAALAKMPVEPFDEEVYVRAKSEVEALGQKQTRFNQIEGVLRRQPEVLKEKQEQEKRQAQVEQDIRQKSTALAASGYDPKRHEELVVRFNHLQTELEQAKERQYSLNKEKELKEQELADKEQELRRFEETARALEEEQVNHYYGEKLGSLFVDFRRELMVAIRPTLAKAASTLYDEMTGHRYAFVELDEKYNLRVMDNGVYYGVERFSGGEKDLANLCLRMSISLALTESAGLTRSFVILDEVFGSQDTERKELILKALARLKNRFPQIFLVTHIEDIKDGVEQIVEVRPTGSGWSEVKVYDAAS